MEITKLQFFSILLLLIGPVLSDSTQDSEEDEVIDLQALLKRVSNSIETFNAERQEMSKEIVQLKNTIAEIKITIAADRKFITEQFDAMKSTIPEVITRQLEEMKNSNVEDHQVIIHELANIRSSIGNMNSTITNSLFQDAKKCNETAIATTASSTEQATTVEEATTVTETKPIKPHDCWEIWAHGKRVNGVFKIYPSGTESDGFQVFCDMETDGGRWTVFQRRGQFGNPTDYFYKTWKEYKDGFGNLEKEFWLGNDKLSILTKSRNYQLRVDMTDRDSVGVFSKYSTFKVEDGVQKYKLTVAGYSGTAGDSMDYQHGQYFTTKDRDNDRHNFVNCAVHHQGAWWYNNCANSNLNGQNLNGARSTDFKGMFWKTWAREYSLCTAEMKIRPNDLNF